MKIEEQNWRKYEQQIFDILTKSFVDCYFEFDDKIFGKYSKIDRQIDIAIRGTIGGNKILGIIDCKYFGKNIDVKIVESFIGMIEDVKANFGIIITNKGFSKAAKNRTTLKNLKLDIIEFDKLNEVKLTFDYFVNLNIRNLELSKAEFFKRCKHNTAYFDSEKSKYEKRLVIFKEEFANTEYFAFKKIIKESARLFRDFVDLDEITIKIPARNDIQFDIKSEEKTIYYSKIKRKELELFLTVDFERLREDIKFWREDFLDNKIYTKQSIYNFAKLHIKSKKFIDYKDEVK